MSTSAPNPETDTLQDPVQEVVSGSPDPQVCDAEHLLRVLRAGYYLLDKQVPFINSLNVFPVPDGDTGTNMSLTMKAALDEVKSRSFTSVSELARVVAHGALMGARGNSGVILSQILRGFARGLDDLTLFEPRDAARAFLEAATTAYKGVMKPVEGTILTVVREAAQAANSAVEQGADLQGCLIAAFEESQRSLARTPSLLPVLADAGVVDAGGQGLTTLLEGMVRHVQGEVVLEASQASAQIGHAQVEQGDYNYDTQFIVQGHDLDIEAMRTRISSFGDSVLVVGDEQTVKVHVHSDHPGMVLDYGITLGQLSAIIIENMQQQFEEFTANQVDPLRPVAHPSSLMGEIGVVAIASGAGLKSVFESLGVGVVVPGGQTMNPSTQDLLNAIECLPQKTVIVLPNNSNIILTAEQARAISSRHVVVLPTRTVPQGIAALLTFNYQANLEENTKAMAEASQRVQTAEITRAVRSVQVNGLCVSEGQIIGLLNDQLVTAGEEVTVVVTEMFDRFQADDYEIVTIYYGDGVSAQEASELADFTRQRYPKLDVEVLDGGQAHYCYIISVE
ncbi:MAG: DAK2 domain-containing protein [Anaerolineae bacterium]